jgi:FOG: Ankyrin repeat
MRKTRCLLSLLGLIFLVTLTGCGQFVSSKERAGTEEFSVYGLKLGDDIKTLLNTVGIPQHKAISDETEKDLVIYYYPDLEIYLSDDKIVGIVSEDKEFATKRGVRIGDDFGQVVAAYASNGLRGFVGGYYRSDRIVGAYVNGKRNLLVFSFNYFAHDEPPIVESISLMSHEAMDILIGINIFNLEFGVELLTAEDWKLKTEERRLTQTAQEPARSADPSPAARPEMEANGDDSSLVHASETGNLEEIRRLLQAGADPNADENGNYALHKAALYGHREVVRLLLDYGADPNAQDFEGGIPLSSAIHSSSQFPNKPPSVIKEIVTDLLNAGADPNRKDEFLSEGTHSFALIDAVVYELSEVVRLLLEAGADPDTPDSEGFTALDYAESAEDPEILQLVREYSNKKSIHVQLYEAVQNNQLKKVQELLNAGADPNRSVALLTSVNQRNIEMIKLLLNSGANPNPEPHHDNTPLSTAVWNNDIELATLLLEAGAKPGRTVYPEIWMAVENGYTDMVRLLLDYGADPNAPWTEDETLLQAAKKAGFAEIAEMLAAAGAQ